jgi:hypothetical protein
LDANQSSTADEAKEQYIEIINSLVKNNTINEKIYFLSSLLLLSFVVSTTKTEVVEVPYLLPRKSNYWVS